MIKVKSFSDLLISVVDEELEDFIADREITRESIITIKFYSAKDELGHLYHYTKLVYEIPDIQTWQCTICKKYTIKLNHYPINAKCICGANSWGRLKNE